MPSALSGAQSYVDGEDSSRLINSSFSKVPKAGPSTHRSPLLHYFWCVYSTNTYDTSLAVDGSDLSTAGVYRGTWLFNLPAILFTSTLPQFKQCPKESNTRTAAFEYNYASFVTHACTQREKWAWDNSAGEASALPLHWSPNPLISTSFQCPDWVSLL